LLLDAQSWYLATDADESGDRATAKWAARAIRVSPPKGNGWTECHQAGVDLGAWWRENVFVDPDPGGLTAGSWGASPWGLVGCVRSRRAPATRGAACPGKRPGSAGSWTLGPPISWGCPTTCC
jgi:hypothetical protein